MPWATTPSGFEAVAVAGGGREASGRETGLRTRTRSLSPSGLSVSVSRTWSV